MSKAPLLDNETIGRLADDLPGWSVSDDRRHLRCTIRFADFDAAFAFVSEAAALARTHDHHPEILFGWGHATVSLTTHDAGGLTLRDVLLASDIAGLVPV